MADFHGALWQSDEYQSRSDLLEPAMVEQLRAARADSTASSRRHQSARGLWTSGHMHYGRGGHRGSKENVTGGGGVHLAFSTAGTHGMPGDYGPSPSPPTPQSASSSDEKTSSRVCGSSANQLASLMFHVVLLSDVRGRSIPRTCCWWLS